MIYPLVDGKKENHRWRRKFQTHLLPRQKKNLFTRLPPSARVPAIDLDPELTSRASNQQKKTRHSLAGKACYYGGDPTAAALHFRAARSSTTPGLPAWEGMALTQVASGDYLGAAKTYEELVRGFCEALGRRKRKGK